MKIQLIAIDMDGTLLRADHRVSPAVIAAIQAARRQGIRIVLTTGRPYSGVREYLALLDMQQMEDYCITYNGALLQRAATGDALMQASLNYSDYRQIEALSAELGCHFHVLDQHSLYTANRTISRHTVYESYLTHIPLIYCEAQRMPAQIQLLKMMLIDEPDIIDQVQARLPAPLYQQFSVIRSSAYFIEFMHPAVSKGNTVRQLAEQLAIAPAQIMAIGDQQNDISMLRYAGVSVAMGNASDDIKALADHVTLSNNADGVAYAIEQWALS